MQVLEVEEARKRIATFEHIFSLRPNSTIAADLAACYFTVGDTEKALPYALKAWEKNKNPNIGMNLALVLKDLGRHEESFRAVQEAYFLNPDDDYIRMGYGEALLRKGFWKQAWPIYDHARQTQLGAALDLGLPSSCKEWQGEDLPEGHLLLIINEGGTGDRLNYARWIPQLSRRGINWRFYPYSALFSVFERIFPRDRLIADGDELIPDPTHWVTTFGLPAKLNVTPTEIPLALSVIAKKEEFEKYRFTRIDNLPIVGFCYEAAEMFQGGRRVRSLTEGQAMRLICMTGDRIHWINLQHDKPMPLPVQNIPFKTWEDTIGLIANLDAVVTIDSAIFWLASSMGKETYLLLAGNSDWKFGEKGRCYWSPTVRYYRNGERGFENSVSNLITDVRKGSALAPYVSNGS